MEIRKTVACIMDDNGKILLVFRSHNPFKNMWAIPGGHIDEGESPETASIRECKEETGLDFSPIYFDDVVERFPDIGWEANLTVFTGAFTGETKISDTEEIKKLGWFTKEEIINMDLAFNHKDILNKYFGVRDGNIS